jgi:adenylate cyclase
MEAQRIERKLAAILATDVKGYSRLMGDDEEGTLRTLNTCRQVIDSRIERHRGRIVGTAGDSVLAEFASVVDAVECAVAVQTRLKTENASLLPDRQMEFRIGINLGDVMVQGEQIYGDGVNIAARLEALADPGGVCISGTVYDQIKNKLALGYEYQGEQTVKNIAEPVRVYRVLLEPLAAATAGQAVLRQAQHERSANRDPVTLSPSKPVLSRVEGGDRTHRVSTAHLTRTVLVSAGLLVVAGIATLLYSSLSPFRTPQSEIRNQEALPLPDKPSIVVLPFTNMSGDPEQEYFSDGMTEDLTTDLSKLSGLFVIARNSAFAYKGQAVDIGEVRRKLGVRYVVEGSVRKVSEQVRITAQLVDTTTNGHLWSERYDRSLQEIFALQDEIRQKIVTALKVKLTKDEQARFQHAPTNNLEAYDYFLRGQEQFWRGTKEANAQARQMYEKAIELDPHYAGAYAMLGHTYVEEWINQWNQDPQILERAFELAQKAVALDDVLPLAHGILGRVYQWKNQHEQAITEGERAVALDPNNAESHVRLAGILSAADRTEEAVEVAKKAMRLNPHYPPVYLRSLGGAYHQAWYNEEAIATIKRYLVYNPNDPVAHVMLTCSYSDLGRDEEARMAAAEVLRLNPNFSTELWKKNQWFRDPAELERHLNNLRKAGLK